jgi:hypothetical protein
LIRLAKPEEFSRLREIEREVDQMFEEVGIGNPVPLTESDSIELNVIRCPDSHSRRCGLSDGHLPVTARTLEIPLLGDL